MTRLNLDELDRMMAEKNIPMEPVQESVEKTPEFEAYFDCSKKQYWIKNSRGVWIPANETQMRRELKISEYRSKTNDDELVSPVEQKLSEIHLSYDVKYAGSVAGRRIGCIEDGDGRILITSEPKLIPPQKGDWKTIKELLESLFEGHNQVDYVYGWLKCSLQAIHSLEFTAGQALVIAGERANGKSFFQNHIVTPLLGGRAAKPYRYMSGATDFNSDLTGAEHLIIEDEVPSTRHPARRHFGARIKDIVANESQSCHKKGQDAISVVPFWRLTITLNDEPENLMMLPPIDDSLEDKIMLLKSSRASNLPGESERASYRDRIYRELPCFVDFLLNEFQIPQELKCPHGRYGVTHFHHPDILNAIQELSPESKLHDILQSVLFTSPVENKWEGRALDLERKLRDSGQGYESSKILTFPNACGTYLGKLKKKYEGKELYTRRIIHGTTYWTIRGQP
ncbi:DUF5906 domain-containing protein [Verrucomicrobia bacterium]|nr:DUF5906 domain-containing protein [Verrucomicrobiota bacterium]